MFLLNVFSQAVAFGICHESKILQVSCPELHLTLIVAADTDQHMSKKTVASVSVLVAGRNSQTSLTAATGSRPPTT